MAKTPSNPDYDYDRDTPPASPGSSGPAPDAGPEIVAAYPTSTLQTWRKELRTPSAGDPGFMAALAGALGMLLDREINHPGRIKRDKATAEANEKAHIEAAKKAIEQRAADATKALGEKPDKDAAAAIEAKKQSEINALDAEAKTKELTTKHEEEWKALQAKQAEEAAKAVPKPTPADAPKTGG